MHDLVEFHNWTESFDAFALLDCCKLDLYYRGVRVIILILTDPMSEFLADVRSNFAAVLD